MYSSFAIDYLQRLRCRYLVLTDRKVNVNVRRQDNGCQNIIIPHLCFCDPFLLSTLYHILYRSIALLK